MKLRTGNLAACCRTMRGVAGIVSHGPLGSELRRLRFETLELRQMLAVSVSAAVPVVDGADVAMLNPVGQFDPGGNEGHVWSNRPIQGQTFTTSGNPGGYELGSITLQNEENTINGNTAGFTVRVGTVSGNTFTEIRTEFANNSISYVPDDYITFTFSTPVTLDPDTLYGFEWDASGSGFTTWNNVNSSYTGGTGYSNGGGGNPDDDNLVFRNFDRIFHVDLTEVNSTLQVTASDPAGGAVLGTPPTTATIDFNTAVDVATVHASDLTLDAAAATGVTIDDPDTLTFDLPPGLPPGEHSMAIAAGALLGDGDLAFEGFTATFTIAELPAVVNSAATRVDATSAEIGAQVTATGGDVPNVTLYYGDNDGATTPGNWDTAASLGPQSGSFSWAIGALVPSTTYYYRALAENVAGAAWALATASFETPAVLLPSVVGSPASSITSASAHLGGEVTDTGGQPPAVTLFYGDQDAGANPLEWDHSISQGVQSGAFSTFVSGLVPESTYFFRAQAENDAGAAWTQSTTFTTSELVSARVVINEIHFDPDLSTEPVEFIELYNTGDQAIDVSGWYFSKGIDYTFPDGTFLAANGYLIVAENPAAVQAKFAVTAMGPYVGRLSNEGERIVVRDAAGTIQDEVDYQLGFPWPTVGGAPGFSIELINPSLDNDLAGSWRSSLGTGGDTLQTFVTEGSPWRYFKGVAEPSAVQGLWREVDFADAGWLSNDAPIGYGDGHVATVLGDMRGNYSTVYLRRSFQVDDASLVTGLVLEAQFDDGINVWINGKHLLGENVLAGELPFGGTAIDAGDNTSYRSFPMPNPLLYLESGENVIAVQLLNASLSGSSDAWFDARLVQSSGSGAGPTPGAPNSVLALNAAPQMRQVKHSPKQPGSNQDVTITVKVTDPHGVDRVTLDYQLVDPGSYIRITDAQYDTAWTTVVMHDDGTDGDATLGDDVYTVVLPGTLQTHRRLVRYRITSTDAMGHSVTGPYADDPQPNFAYFVYDGVPAWTGSLRPGVDPNVTYAADVMSDVATYHLIAVEQDVINSQYSGSYRFVQFPGTIVYDGVVYDHIEFRNRGRVSVYTVGKNKWKINFTRGHAFEARDNFGRKYDVSWDKINVLPGTNPWWRWNQSTEGTILFEPTAFRLYELAGTPSSHTQFFQFRVIDSAEEAEATSQYEGDFWGLYIAIEQPDHEFLESRNLPDGNIYNMHGTGGSQRTQGSLLPTDRSDLNAFVNGYKAGSQPLSWWEQNLNFDSYFAWNAINLAANNADARPEENVNYYHNQETGLWYMLPWDLDLTFEDGPHYSNWEDIDKVLSQHSSVNIAYQSRVREILDLLLDNGEGGLVVEELANVLTKGQATDTIVEANQAMWDYHPRKSKKGIWYENFNPNLLPSEDFAGLVAYMKTFLTVGGYGRDRLAAQAADSAIPNTPTMTYVGLPGFPSNGLAFRSSSFSDPQGSGSFAAMQWRVAEVHNPDVADYDPAVPYIYEIEGTWQSDELTVFDNEITLPPLAMEVGHAYRARVRMQDNTGRWSHWSEPVQFTTTDPNESPLSSWLRITEVMYNPAEPTPEEIAAGFTDKDLFEFIELHNTGNVPLDLSNVELTDGVHFVFGTGNVTSLAPDKYAVVVKDVDAFTQRYGSGINVAGEYAVETEKLSNGGERITLADTQAGVLFDFDYDDDDGWPGRADGKGASLVLIAPDDVPNGEAARAEYLSDPDNWQSSNAYLGTPGTAAEPHLGIVINEVLSHTDWPLVDAIELFNAGDMTVNLGGWFLSDSWGWDPLVVDGGNDSYKKFRIPDDTTLGPGQYVTFDERDFNPTPVDSLPAHFALDGAHGDDVWLMEADGTDRLVRFVDHVDFPDAAEGESFGRWPDAQGRLYPMRQRSFGSANVGPRVGPVVISELMYNPTVPNIDANPDDFEYIEIYNPTLDAIGLTNWRVRKGIAFDFPTGSVLSSGETLLVVSFAVTDAARLDAFRSYYQLAPSIRIMGPYSGRLNDDGEKVQLQRPDSPPADEQDYIPHLIEDEVIYTDLTPWPLGPDGTGTSLARQRLSAWGNDAASWGSEAPTPGTVTITDDDYEPNNSWATASLPAADWSDTPLSTIAGLGIQTDADWYRIDVPGNQRRLTVDVTFSHALGNIDMQLVDSTGSVYETSQTTTDNEQIDAVLPHPGTWYLNVFGDNTASVYDLVYSTGYAHPGDANLDGATDLSDFNIWNANKFMTETDWAAGDFSGDGSTDLTDFNIWNAFKFTIAPPLDPAPPAAAAGELADSTATIDDLAWLRESQQSRRSKQSSDASTLAAEAVDRLLATYWG